MRSHAIPLTQNSIDTGAFLARTVLVHAALASQPRGLLVITAPTGYGKSTLARHIGEHWAQHQARPLRSWTVRNTTTLAQALRSFCEAFGVDVRPTLPSPDVAADWALEALASCKDPGVLLVDLDGPPPAMPVKTLAAQILTEFALQHRVVVACRSPWLLSLERIALSAPVQIFEAADLAFDAGALMQLHGIDAVRAQRWLAATEGWPLLCGPRLPAVHDPLSDDAETLTALLADRAADYLEHELLATLPSRDAQLLMRASIFEAIEPGTLESLGGEHSWTRFCGLLETALPVSLSCSTRDRIVLHPVLRAFLGRRLRAHSPAIHHSLHRRAAAGYEASGNYRLALAHARQTGDPAFVDQITENSGGWRLSLREGLHAIDGGSRRTAASADFPKAALARAYWLAQTGRLDDAEALMRELEGTPASAALRPDVDTINAVIGVYRDAPFNENRTSRLSATPRLADNTDGGVGPGAATVTAAMLNNAGLYERAVAVAREAALDAAASGSRYVEFYGQWECGIALHGLGHVADAQREYARALALAAELLGETSNEVRVIGLNAAHAAWLAGDNALAERLAGDLGGLFRLHAWFEPYARALDVATALSRSRGDGVLETQVLQSFGELALRRELPRLAVLVDLAHARQSRADGDAEAATRHCEAASRKLLGLAEGAPETLRVSAPVALEGLRQSVMAGRLNEAAERHGAARPDFVRCGDGALTLEASLLEAYLAVHARQYATAGLRLQQCVLRARRHGLTRPFLDNAALIGELVECVRSRTLPIDSSILHSALQMCGTGEAPGMPRLRANPTHKGRMLLTEREVDILHFLADGLSSKEMARRLNISEGTVKTHRKHLYEKLNAGLRSQAIMRAREIGLL